MAQAEHGPRPGLVALDPDSGLPLSRNPGRHPRGVGAAAIHVGSTHVWVGSDTEWIGNFQYKRPRLAGFANIGGPALADETQPGLPGDVFVAGNPGSGTGLSRGTFTGTDAGPVSDIDPMGLDWSRVRGAFLVGGRLFYGWDTGKMYVRSFDGSALGPAAEVDPYHDPAWAGVSTGSGTSTYTGVAPSFYGQVAGPAPGSSAPRRSPRLCGPRPRPPRVR